MVNGKSWRGICRALSCALLAYFVFLALANHRAGAVWFSASMLAIQYCDYPFDNHTKCRLKRCAPRCARSSGEYALGALTSLLCMMIPVLNLLIMPVAVCGATAMWVDCWRAVSTRYGNNVKNV